MAKTLILFSAILLNFEMASATGMVMKATCTPVVTEEGQVTIVFKSISMSPPGGPVRTTQSVTIDGSEYAQLQKDNGKYEQGLTVKSVPLKYPSGAVSSSLKFITVVPGKSVVKPVNEVLYNCSSKPGN